MTDPVIHADLTPEIRARSLAIRDQNGRGTCSVFASTFLMEYQASILDHSGIDYSEEYLNAVMNVAEGTHNDGGSFDQIALGYQEYGIVPETAMPYENHFDPHVTPSLMELNQGEANRSLAPIYIRAVTPVGPHSAQPRGITSAQLLLMRALLDQGMPIAIGFGANAIDGTLMNGPRVGVRQLWDPSHVLNLTTIWAHSVPVVGYRVDARAPGGVRDGPQLVG